MSKITEFINIVNKTYFNNEKESELHQLYESIQENKPELKTNSSTPVVSQKSVCTFVMKSGSRKGEACGKGCMKNNTLCSLHKEKPVEEKKDHIEVSEEKEKDSSVVTESTTGKTEDQKVKKVQKEKPIKEKKDKVVSTEACKSVFKTGDRIGQVCGDTTKTCPHQKPIHIRKCGEWSVLTGTTVVFDKKRQVIIGYKQDDKHIFEENDEVRTACITYDLLFSKVTV